MAGLLWGIDNKLECCARELLAYLDTELAVEESLPFAVGYLVEQMRAAVFAKTVRTLAPAHRCRIYGRCRYDPAPMPPDIHGANKKSQGACYPPFRSKRVTHLRADSVRPRRRRAAPLYSLVPMDNSCVDAVPAIVR